MSSSTPTTYRQRLSDSYDRLRTRSRRGRTRREMVLWQLRLIDAKELQQSTLRELMLESARRIDQGQVVACSQPLLGLNDQNTQTTLVDALDIGQVQPDVALAHASKSTVELHDALARVAAEIVTFFGSTLWLTLMVGVIAFVWFR